MLTADRIEPYLDFEYHIDGTAAKIGQDLAVPAAKAIVEDVVWTRKLLYIGQG